MGACRYRGCLGLGHCLEEGRKWVKVVTACHQGKRLKMAGPEAMSRREQYWSEFHPLSGFMALFQDRSRKAGSGELGKGRGLTEEGCQAVKAH